MVMRHLLTEIALICTVQYLPCQIFTNEDLIWCAA
jgi:hypothetical protein